MGTVRVSVAAQSSQLAAAADEILKQAKVEPPPPQGDAGAFISALMHTGYLYVVATLQILGGLCLLSGRFAPLGLTLLGPVIFNILCFHIFLDPSGMPIAIVISILALFLLWAYRDKFPAIFNP